MTHWAVSTGNHENEKNTGRFSYELVKALDIDRILEMVARHAGTARGRRALLSLAQPDEPRASKLANQGMSKYQRTTRLSTSTSSGRSKAAIARIATSIEEARREYERVEQAMTVLQGEQNLTYPPLYGKESGPFDTSTVADTDFDEWMQQPADSWTLEHVLYAEQLCQMITNVHSWANDETHRYWAPFLVEILDTLEVETVNRLLDDLKGSVEVARVRSLTDPNARSTFTFVLSESKFSVLRALRKRLKDLESDESENPSKKKIVDELREEIRGKEFEIQDGLNTRILACLNALDRGLDLMARLDLIFMKAAFGVSTGGTIPTIRDKGEVRVESFVHPLLLMSKERRKDFGEPVPVDLHLSRGKRALVIGGPNGGGKTLAMKSFGVVASCCTKIGIPIPVTYKSEPGTNLARVDFFDDILTSIGDHQNVEEGESTFMALLNGYSRILSILDDTKEQSTLVLLDELGTGTEASAGGAIGQAILEKMLENPLCQVVSTTHSSRLKTISYEREDFESATTISRKVGESKYESPLFKLEYGVIGESNALAAASRARPPLSDDILARADELLTSENADSSSSASYMTALRSSLEEQIDRYSDLVSQADRERQDTYRCQGAMVSLAASYDKHLASLEERVNRCYAELKAEKNNLDLLGDTLSQLRAVRKQVKREEQLLRERGLRPVDDSYDLLPGDTVIIADGGELDGMGGTVREVDFALAINEVAIELTDPWILNTNDDKEESGDRVQVFQRHQLAVWDYNGYWENVELNTPPSRSIPDSKRRISSLLASISAEGTGKGSSATAPPVSMGKKKGPTFQSSRERKAQKKKNKKR